MTRGELLREGRGRLPHREADWLLQQVTGMAAAMLRVQADAPVSDAVTDAYRQLVQRRVTGEPLAYLLGNQPFRQLDLTVNEHVLIPRPETEDLVDHALALLPATARLRALDLGTGSGAIALALAAERPAWTVTAVEASEPALAVARANGLRLGLAVEWLRGDWWQPLADRRFALIVSNPPYVGDNDPELAPDVAAHEPPGALLAGPDGLDAIRVIADRAPAHLEAGGWLILEHGHRQAAAVRDLLRDAGLTGVTSNRDQAGHERFTAGHREEASRG